MIKKIIRIALFAIVLTVIFINMGALIAKKAYNKPMATVFGYGTAVVLSGSMEPTLHVNDLVFIKETRDVEPGDIVMYMGNSSLVIHRLIDIDDTYIYTKGDANNVADDPVPKERIVGKYVGKIDGAGGIINNHFTPVAILLFFVIALLLVIFTGDDTDEDRLDEENERLKKEIEELLNSKENISENDLKILLEDKKS